MKKLMFAFCFVFGGLAVYAQEQDTTSQQDQFPPQQEQQDPAQQEEQDQYRTEDPTQEEQQDPAQQEQQDPAQQEQQDPAQQQQEDQYRTEQQDTAQGQGMQDQDRERISSRDLPDAVKRSLEGTDYRGWLVNAAYRTTGSGDETGNQEMQSDTTSVYGEQGNQGMEGDTTGISGQSGASGQEVYIVELKNGAQTKTVRFDKDGNQLDDQGLEDQDQK